VAPSRAGSSRGVAPSLNSRDVHKLIAAGFSHDLRSKSSLETAGRQGQPEPDSMLPVTVQFLVAMLAYGLNERMARKAEYLREENRRYLVGTFVHHYLTERFHQGLGGQLIRPLASATNDDGTAGAIQCRSRLGGLLNFYHREAA
jgi:hypothetical protein